MLLQQLPMPRVATTATATAMTMTMTMAPVGADTYTGPRRARAARNAAGDAATKRAARARARWRGLRAA